MALKNSFSYFLSKGGPGGCPLFFSDNGKDTPHCNCHLGPNPHCLLVFESAENLDVKIIINYSYL